MIVSATLQNFYSLQCIAYQRRAWQLRCIAHSTSLGHMHQTVQRACGADLGTCMEVCTALLKVQIQHGLPAVMHLR